MQAGLPNPSSIKNNLQPQLLKNCINVVRSVRETGILTTTIC